ncbi:MAG TPA: FHA domain-containing protein, partial [Polyangiaceae bacterium]|nr:FHA domain-containing protein [Polyangiaceae bacterium]
MRPSKSRELGAPPNQEQPRELPYELVTYEGRQPHRVGLPHHIRLPSCGSVLIGRAPDCEVRIENVSVSRRHAIIHLNQLEVEDIASRNGSALFSDAPSWESVAEAAPGAGRVLEPGRRYPLRPGDFLKVGSVVLTLKRATQPQHTEPVLHEEPLNESEVVVQGAVMRDLYEVA